MEGLDKVSWIKELVKTEQQMEESGIVDVHYGVDKERILTHDTLQFLLQLKTEFVDLSSAFNELKTSPLGRIKIYGIAKTHADFMLFRNGFKMIFSLQAPGQISIKFNFIGAQFMASPQAAQEAAVQVSKNLMDEQMVEAKWGPFGEVIWTFQNQPININYMVRHYMTLFVKESAR